MMEQERFTLILTDFNMGGKDGLFLLATARERCPETLRLLMTGYTDDQIRRDADEKGGVAAFIRKPWNNQELLQLVGRLLADTRG